MRILEIACSPVKGLDLLYPDQVDLTPLGVPNDRRFFLVDDRCQMVNRKRVGRLVQVQPDFDAASQRLTLRFPDGREVSDAVEVGEPIEAIFYGRPRPGRLVNGPWAAALSEWAEEPVQLAVPREGLSGVDRGVAGGISLASQASVDRLARELGVEQVDRRRFRMTFWIDGVDEPHAEDAWVGRRVALGDAVVHFHGHVGRCAVTTQNPDSGVPDLDTLHGLNAYRDPATTTSPLALGVWGEVITPGRVRVGDEVRLDSLEFAAS
jgi:uncharacterized protein